MDLLTFMAFLLQFIRLRMRRGILVFSVFALLVGFLAYMAPEEDTFTQRQIASDFLLPQLEASEIKPASAEPAVPPLIIEELATDKN